MLAPIHLRLCHGNDLDRRHTAASTSSGANLWMATQTSVVRNAALVGAGQLSAWLAFRYLALTLMAQSSSNVDGIWDASLFWSACCR